MRERQSLSDGRSGSSLARKVDRAAGNENWFLLQRRTGSGGDGRVQLRLSLPLVDVRDEEEEDGKPVDEECVNVITCSSMAVVVFCFLFCQNV
nr:hypothetical protein Itr_chr01CG13880 [Ipomoea trifida]